MNTNPITCPSHTIHFTQVDGSDPTDLYVQASEKELHSFAENGFLIRERCLPMAMVEGLRAALMALADAERGAITADSYGKQYGGAYIRGLPDKHRSFHDLIQYPPITSIVQAMLGPRVQIRSFTGRITYPGTEQATMWHIDQRSWVEPRPLFFVYPQVINCIYYLDDVTPDNGPLYVMPGTHRSSTPPPTDCWQSLPGEIALCVPAGSVVMINCGVWHRGGANGAHGSIRRNLLIDHNPVWMKALTFDGYAPCGGPLTQALIQKGDQCLRELLGQGGGN